MYFKHHIKVPRKALIFEFKVFFYTCHVKLLFILIIKGKSDLKNTQGFPQTSKDRRDQENKGINEAKVYFPLSQKERDNLSKLQSLHYASIFVKWNVEKSKLNSGRIFCKPS